jgi:hypothetical protein
MRSRFWPIAVTFALAQRLTAASWAGASKHTDAVAELSAQ